MDLKKLQIWVLTKYFGWSQKVGNVANMFFVQTTLRISNIGFVFRYREILNEERSTSSKISQCKCSLSVSLIPKVGGKVFLYALWYWCLFYSYKRWEITTLDEVRDCLYASVNLPSRLTIHWAIISHHTYISGPDLNIWA